MLLQICGRRVNRPASTGIKRLQRLIRQQIWWLTKMITYAGIVRSTRMCEVHGHPELCHPSALVRRQLELARVFNQTKRRLTGKGRNTSHLRELKFYWTMSWYFAVATQHHTVNHCSVEPRNFTILMHI